MYFGLHSTKKAERDLVMSKTPTLIEVSPRDIHGTGRHKPIIWEEDTGKYYEHSIDAFMECLKQIDAGTFNPANNPYIAQWGYKGEEPRRRMERLPALYKSIKEEGIKEPISVGIAGERFDGSFRSKIALHLGIKKLKANQYYFDWREVDEDFIRRKIDTHWFSTGKEYYEFEYGYQGMKNIYEGGEVYRENAAPRWELIRHHLKGNVLDLGCNEGYLTIQAALHGHKAVGYDIDCIHGANLNKLVFEWVNKKDLPVYFFEGDMTKVDPKGFDTILILCAIYHLPRKEQVPFLKKFKGKNVILQCNLRKEAEREKYYGSHPDDLRALLKEAGLTITNEVLWKDKPLIIAS